MAVCVYSVHENSVHYIRMLKNITLSADESLIEQARKLASDEDRTLNELFREWLEQYVAQPEAAARYELLLRQLDHVEAGRHFTREELNER
jgi:hypothetical protein